jgi:hypothetical protein
MQIIRSIRLLLLTLVMLSASGLSSAQVLISVNFGPPALPVYEQPFCPGDGYIWLPGYWAWSPVGYYWVPGTWALAPEPGLLWTPGYWAFDDGLYFWHPGYWGPVVGFYGGIPYGYGYPGTGYYGGYWRGRQFYYNQTVNNVNITNVRNVYSATVINNTTTVDRVSYNGGPGGTMVRPTAEQEAAARERHVAPTSVQMQHEHAASTNRAMLASVNQGRPPVAATPKPAEFSGRGVIAASPAGVPYKAPENRAAPPRASGPENNLPQRENERRMNPAPRPEVPRPPNVSERENAARGENNPHPQREVRPETPAYPQREARPENERHPGKEPPQNKPTHSDRRTPPPNRDEDRPH